MSTERIYFDGGCRPNPGPIEVAVVHRDQVRIDDAQGQGDSSEAEWRALLVAVGYARSAGLRDVCFVGDNAMVVAQARGRAACRARLRPLLEAYRAAIAGFDRVQVRQVARSKNPAGVALARRAEALASSAHTS